MNMAILCRMKHQTITEIHLLYTRSMRLKVESKAGLRSLERAYTSWFNDTWFTEINPGFSFNSAPLGTPRSFWRLP